MVDNNKIFHPWCLPTAVGGMPHRDIQKANQFILDTLDEIPHLPMLPKATLKSGSPIRFLEGMPCLVRTKGGTECHIQTSDTEFTHRELEVFYEKYDSGDISYFEMTDDYAPDIYGMIEYLRKRQSERWVMLNCGVRGPVTLGMQVLDESGRPIFYNELFRDALTKTIYMKIKWLERRIMAVLSDLPLLIMLAEPGLSMQGSPLYTLEENVIVNTLNEVLSATRQFTMIHCCGNIDWPILMHTDVSIINFDAYQHSDRFTIYHGELREYLEKGKMIAWGIVPTTEEEFRKESVPGLVSRLENILHALIDRGFQRQFLLSSALITPSCSTAGLSVHMAEEVYKTTLDVANALRAKYFGHVTESQK